MLPFCDVGDFEIAIFSIKNLMKLIKYIFKIIFNLSQLKLCARKAKVYLFRRPMRVQRRLFRQYGFVTISHVVEIAFFDFFRFGLHPYSYWKTHSCRKISNIHKFHQSIN